MVSTRTQVEDDAADNEKATYHYQLPKRSCVAICVTCALVHPLCWNIATTWSLRSTAASGRLLEGQFISVSHSVSYPDYIFRNNFLRSVGRHFMGNSKHGRIKYLAKISSQFQFLLITCATTLR